MIHYEKVTCQKEPDMYMVFIEKGGQHIGDIMMEVDGFYYFWPLIRGGFWESHILMDVARKLDALNEAWKQRIEKEMEKLDGKKEGPDYSGLDDAGRL